MEAVALKGLSSGQQVGETLPIFGEVTHWLGSTRRSQAPIYERVPESLVLVIKVKEGETRLLARTSHRRRLVRGSLQAIVPAIGYGMEMGFMSTVPCIAVEIGLPSIRILCVRIRLDRVKI